jgi:hypothetical protein
MKAAAFGLLLTASGLTALGAVAAPGAKAACLTSDLIGFGTDCVTFEAGQSATAKVFFSDANLQPPGANPNFQIGFSSSLGTAITLSNLSWSSSQNGTYAPLLTGSFTSGINSNYSYSGIQTTNAANSPVPTGSPFWVKYDIPAGLASGTQVSIQLRSNADTSSTGGVLNAGGSTPNAVVLSRVNTAVVTPPPITGEAAPGPLPLLGAGAAFGVSRRLRRRIRATA